MFFFSRCCYNVAARGAVTSQITTEEYQDKAHNCSASDLSANDHVLDT